MKKSWRYFLRFDTIPECDGRTDRYLCSGYQRLHSLLCYRAGKNEDVVQAVTEVSTHKPKPVRTYAQTNRPLLSQTVTPTHQTYLLAPPLPITRDVITELPLIVYWWWRVHTYSAHLFIIKNFAVIYALQSIPASRFNHSTIYLRVRCRFCGILGTWSLCSCSGGYWVVNNSK